MSAIDEKRFIALGREWVSRFDFNAMCAIEERRGCAFLEVVAPMLQRVDTAEADNQESLVQAARSIRMIDIRMLFHESLLGAQPKVTEEEAGELIGEIGFQEAMGIVAWAVVRGINAGGGAAGDENPPKTATKKAAIPKVARR